MGVPPARFRQCVYLRFSLDLSVTVVRGLRFAVDFETNRPLMAPLARVMRLPPSSSLPSPLLPLDPRLKGHDYPFPTHVHRMRTGPDSTGRVLL